MSVGNPEIAAALSEMADLLEVQAANPFRVQAYRRAASTVGALGPPVDQMIERGGTLAGLRGIGADLAALAQLREAAEAGRIAAMRGFGLRLQQQVLDACRMRLEERQRMPLPGAARSAGALLAQLRAVPSVQQAELAGSLRRQRDTVGDIDMVASARLPAEVIRRFCAQEAVRSILARGTTRASVVLEDGLQADLRVVDATSFGAAWLYFSGSKDHNIALRRIAHEAGLKLNEYGLYRGTVRIAGETEAGIYAGLGLPWIEPELREDQGEIEAARAGQLPALLSAGDLRGDLHVRSPAPGRPDGLRSLALAARALGLAYLAVADPGPAAGGLDAGALARQGEEIDALNASLQGITLLKGVQATIGRDGTLDLPDAALAPLDLVAGAVCTDLDLARGLQTDRLLRAMDRPHFTVLAHPLGRLLGERGPCALDLQRLLRHARQRGCFVQASGDPRRLDLDGAGCRLAGREGVLVSVTSAAGAPGELAQAAWALGQARRGWLRAGDVLNTLPLAGLRPLLRASMSQALSRVA